MKTKPKNQIKRLYSGLPLVREARTWAEIDLGAVCHNYRTVAAHVKAAVGKGKMPDVLCKVSDAIKPGGILYASFKYGSEERNSNGRFFNDYTEHDLDILLTPENRLFLLEYWITEDVRPDRTGERWLNFIAVKR